MCLYFVALLFVPFVSLSLSLSRGGSVPPERPVDLRGNSRSLLKILCVPPSSSGPIRGNIQILTQKGDANRKRCTSSAIFSISALCFLSRSLSPGTAFPQRGRSTLGGTAAGERKYCCIAPTPCGLSFPSSEFLSCQISTNVECPDGIGRVAGFGRSTDRVDQ